MSSAGCRAQGSAPLSDKRATCRQDLNLPYANPQTPKPKTPNPKPQTQTQNMPLAGKSKIALVPKEKVDKVEAAYRAALDVTRAKEEAEAASLRAQQAAAATSRFAGRSAAAGAAGALVKDAGPRAGHAAAAGAGDEARQGQAGSALEQLSCVMAQIDQVMQRAPSITATSKVLFNLADVPPEEVSRKILETFDQLDLDTRGSLDKHDFMEGCALLGKKLSEEEVEAWIAEADVDGNGTVDKEEFEHCTRQAFLLSCAAQCTICCMNAMTAAASEPRQGAKATARLSGKQPKSPQRSAGGGGRQLRLQIRERIKGSEPVKSLAGSMLESQALHKELEQMKTGFRRTYSAPSPIPDEQLLQGRDMPPQQEQHEPEEPGPERRQDKADSDQGAAGSKQASAPQPPTPETSASESRTLEPEQPEQPEQPEAAAPAAPRRCSVAEVPRFATAEARREQAAAELKEEMARIRARAFRRASSAGTCQ